MKKKKYIIILIISFLLIAAEAVGFVLVALPYMKIELIYEAVEKSDQAKVEKLSKNLNDNTKKKTVEVLNSYSAYIVEQYGKKKMSFDDCDGHFKAMVVSNGSFDEVVKYYDSQIIGDKAVGVVDKAYPEFVNNGDSLAMDDYAKEFLACVEYQPVCKKETEQYVIDYINQKYESYKAGQGDFETARTYANVGKKLSQNGSDDFYATIANLSDTLDLIASYEQDIRDINDYVAQKNYIDAVTHADTVLNVMQSDTTGYLDKIKTLRDEAYEAGKAYYPSYIQELVNGGDYKTAKEIVAKIEPLYGNDIDMTALQNMVKEPWKTAYIEYISKLDENLTRDIAAKNNISDYDKLVDFDYTANKPGSIFLHDFDGNGTPEVLLADTDGDDKYWYILGFDGTSCKFLGTLWNATIASDNRVVMQMTTPGENSVGYEVLKVSSTSIELTTSIISINSGESYKVDGEDADSETATAKLNEIKNLAEGDHANVNDGTYIDSAEAFIDGYVINQ